MDTEIRKLEKEYAADGTLASFVKLQKKKCQIGDHHWSFWELIHHPQLHPDRRRVNWEGFLNRTTAFSNRECLCCNARQRKIERLGKETQDRYGQLVITGHEKIETVIVDL